MVNFGRNQIKKNNFTFVVIRIINMVTEHERKKEMKAYL